MIRVQPDSTTIILKQGLYRIIWQTARLAENCGLPISPPGQTIVTPYPNTSIHPCYQRCKRVAGQSLFRRNRRDGEISKPVQSPRTGKSDIPFTILEETTARVA